MSNNHARYIPYNISYQTSYPVHYPTSYQTSYPESYLNSYFEGSDQRLGQGPKQRSQDEKERMFDNTIDGIITNDIQEERIHNNKISNEGYVMKERTQGQAQSQAQGQAKEQSQTQTQGQAKSQEWFKITFNINIQTILIIIILVFCFTFYVIHVMNTKINILEQRIEMIQK